jgi:hypothetical protein
MSYRICTRVYWPGGAVYEHRSISVFDAGKATEILRDFRAQAPCALGLIGSDCWMTPA